MVDDAKSAEQFVGEPVAPVPATGDARMMARGGPGLPRQFTWRGTTYEVEAVLETHRTLGPCTSGSGEQYVRKHWYEVQTASGARMKLYFERQPRPGKSKRARWWLFTTEDSDAGREGAGQ